MHKNSEREQDLSILKGCAAGRRLFYVCSKMDIFFGSSPSVVIKYYYKCNE